MGSLLGANLIHLPSLVSTVLGVLEVMKIFQYDLQPGDLDLWPHGVTHRAEPSLVEIKLGVIEILKIFLI